MEDVFFKFTGRDTYKAVKQYIKNGLGLSKENIELEIKNAGIQYAERVLDSKAIELEIDRMLERKINSAFGRYDPDTWLIRIVEDAVRRTVEKRVDEIMKEKFVDIMREVLTSK